eukprot:234988_1
MARVALLTLVVSVLAAESYAYPFQYLRCPYGCWYDYTYYTCKCPPRVTYAPTPAPTTPAPTPTPTTTPTPTPTVPPTPVPTTTAPTGIGNGTTDPPTPSPTPACKPCMGGTVWLKIRYTSYRRRLVHIMGPHGRMYGPTWIYPGRTLDLYPDPGYPTLGQYIQIYENGNYYKKIYVDCNHPLYMGKRFGHFQVSDGMSMNGGMDFCPPTPAPTTPSPTPTEPIQSLPPVGSILETQRPPNNPTGIGGTCQSCAGGVTFLDIEYLGSIPLNIMITTDDVVVIPTTAEMATNGMTTRLIQPGEVIQIRPPPGQSVIPTAFNIFTGVNNPQMMARRSTDCSQPIFTGMQFSGFHIINGASATGGLQNCT